MYGGEVHAFAAQAEHLGRDPADLRELDSAAAGYPAGFASGGSES